jgi:hypothetical protein
LGNSPGELSNSTLSQIKFSVYAIKSLSIDNFVMQVEISGGRGKPSTIIDKDEGLGKVNTTKGKG